MKAGIGLSIGGLIIIILTLLKPNFYWNSRSTQRARNLYGDTSTSVIYIIMGLVFLGMGIMQFF